MDIELLYFDGCPHWRTAAERLDVVAGELGASVRLRAVTEPGRDGAESFAGSPTVLVDGRDPFPGAALCDDLSCRIYSTPEGPAGSPTLAQLRTALGPNL